MLIYHAAKMIAGAASRGLARDEPTPTHSLSRSGRYPENGRKPRWRSISLASCMPTGPRRRRYYFGPTAGRGVICRSAIGFSHLAAAHQSERREPDRKIFLMAKYQVGARTTCFGKSVPVSLQAPQGKAEPKRKTGSTEKACLSEYHTAADVSNQLLTI
jgi:hypothetical protein